MSEEIENSPQPTQAEPALDQVAATVIRAKREVAKVATQQRLGQDGRRGPLRYGERVQITDTKKRMSTFVLEEGGYFQSVRGNLHHSEIVGLNEGSVIETASGHELMIMRPLLADYVLSMPRGAQVVYPKDSGNIVAMADIFPGARVLEAGVGSGALTMSLLSAIGEEGKLISIERREDFARIAAANVDAWFGRHHRAWQLHSGDFAQVVADLVEDASIDRVVLDMLAPWENVEQSARALAPGGVFCAYVATVTQMSRTVEALRGTQSFSEPLAWETMSRGWHVDGLAVRPDHRMVGHTGFLVLARRLATGSKPLSRRQTGRGGAYDDSGYWVADDVDERTSTDRKVRKVLRDCLVKQPDDATKVNVQATSTRGALTDQVAQTLGLDAVQRPAFKE